MIRKKERPDLAEIDIPLASTGAIDKKKLSESDLKRRREHIKRFLFTFISVTLVLIAVGAILFLYSRRDRISSRSIKTMWNSFWGIEISSETLDWNLTDEAAFAPFQGGVVAADVTGVRSLGADGIEVTKKMTTVEEAKAEGAMALFGAKYGDQVSLYSIGDISKEICCGPHVANTKELGSFKIKKEESSSAGVRRIKAVIGNLS